MTDSVWAQLAYADDTDPIELAVQIAEQQIGAAAEIAEARRHNPGAYPVFLGSLTSEAVARRVVGHLLDAGWTPPATPKEINS